MKTVAIIGQPSSLFGFLGLARFSGFWKHPLFRLGLSGFLSCFSFFRFFKINLRKENAPILKKNALIVMAAPVPVFLTPMLGSTLPCLSLLGFVGCSGYVRDKRWVDN